MADSPKRPAARKAREGMRHWLRIAEDRYQAGDYNAATAAAEIARVYATRGMMSIRM